MQAHNGSSSQEDRIQIRTILKFGLVLVIVAIFMHVVVWFLFQYFRNQTTLREPPLTPLAPRQQVKPPEPRLQVTPVLDLQRLHEEENKTLNSYGWVDSQKGVVRIPISRAMEIIVQKGNLK